jgi:hypothetical protein
MTLIGLVIWLAIIGVCLYLINLLPIDGTIKTIIRVVVILFVLLWLLQGFGVFGVGPVLRFR